MTHRDGGRKGLFPSFDRVGVPPDPGARYAPSRRVPRPEAAAPSEANRRRRAKPIRPPAVPSEPGRARRALLRSRMSARRAPGAERTRDGPRAPSEPGHAAGWHDRPPCVGRRRSAELPKIVRISSRIGLAPFSDSAARVGGGEVATRRRSRAGPARPGPRASPETAGDLSKIERGTPIRAVPARNLAALVLSGAGVPARTTVNLDVRAGTPAPPAHPRCQTQKENRSVVPSSTL